MDFSSSSSTKPRWELPIYETPHPPPPPAPEMEHMFDKVVTPSDVGKLNRLVIPKQHAEKHFPLDSSSSEKGLLLDFEDRSGKSWRFRYSYWNSSQSYVMTKGWSRFVKEKKLDAGDVVSFHRALRKDQFFIDWRRRPDAPPPPPLPPHHLGFQFQHHQHGYRPFLVGPRPPPQLPLPSTVFSYNGLTAGYNNNYNYNYNYQNLWQQQRLVQSSSSNPSSVVLESVPVGPRSVAGKRLRLFGVNMDCTVTERGQVSVGDSSTTSSSPELQLRLHGDGSTTDSAATDSTHQIEFLDKGKSSMTLDFDI